MSIKLPDKLSFLFQPIRHKVAHGGRSSAKSWSFARALLVQGANQKERILCTREVQKSIKDSVHRLLRDQIVAMGLEDFYDVLDNEIRGRNGTAFLFAGLSDQTALSIKSYEGVTKCWVEEAQSVSKRSWDILLPTIRAPGSEVWVTFNPDLDTDYTWQYFVENTPPKSVVVHMGWQDNPWFGQESEDQRQHCLLTDKDNYDNIWEGKCRVAVAGAIYAKEYSQMVEEGRITNVPYDPRLKVHTIWDMGWNDSMSIILAQRGVSEMRIIGYMEDDHKTLDWYAAELNKLNYNWGKDWLPHDANAGDYKTGKTAHQILRSFSRKTDEVPQIGVENGIKMTRMLLPRLVMDKAKTARLQECIKRYRRSINAQTQEPGAPVHDEWSHGADDLRYLGVVADKLVNEEEFVPNVAPYRGSETGMGMLG